MNGDKIMDAIGMIDEELIIEARETRRKFIRKRTIISLVAAIIVFIALGITSFALGWFENRIIGIKIINEYFDEVKGIDSYNIKFNVEIKEDAKEVIEKYYLPMILMNGEYNASANSYSGRFYWENPEDKKQIIAFVQYSALAYDEYSISFNEKMKVTKEKFIFNGEEIQSIVFTPEEKESNSIKEIYWLDGYNIFEIMSYNCEYEFIVEIIESLEIVEDFSKYGKLRENVYH